MTNISVSMQYSVTYCIHCAEVTLCAAIIVKNNKHGTFSSITFPLKPWTQSGLNELLVKTDTDQCFILSYFGDPKLRISLVKSVIDLLSGL